MGDPTETLSNSPLQRSQVHPYSDTCSISPCPLPGVPFPQAWANPTQPNPTEPQSLCELWAVSHTHAWGRLPLHRGQADFCFLTHELALTCQAAGPGEPDNPKNQGQAGRALEQPSE